MDLKVCRLCLKTTNLTNIFEEVALMAKIQVQATSILSETIFEGDGFPNYLCSLCISLVEMVHFYKQNCKKAEIALKQYSFMTKKLPEPFEISLNPLRDYLKKSQVTEDKETATEVLQLIEKGTQYEEVQEEKKQKLKELEKKVPKPLPEKKALKPQKIQIVEDKQQKEKLKSTQKRNLNEYFKPKAPKILNTTLSNDEVIIPEIISQELIAENEIEFKIVPVAPPKKVTPTKKSKDSAVLPRLLNIELKNPPCGVVEFKTLDAETEDGEVVMELVQSEAVAIVFACSYCERSFPLRQQLEIHEQQHFRDREFSCDSCDSRFMSKHDLAKHLPTHAAEKPWKCIVCSKRFSRSNILKNHQKIHEDQMKFACNDCDSRFLTDTDLEAHMKSEHLQERKFKCTHCEKSFRYKQGLERHLPSHILTFDLPFPCEICKLSFATAGKLAKHLQTHAGERRYPCKYCPKVFKWSHHLTRHVRGHLNGTLREKKDVHDVLVLSKQFSCNFCEEVFETSDAFVAHCVKHCANEEKCPICDVNVAENHESHVRAHMNEVLIDEETLNEEEFSVQEELAKQEVPSKKRKKLQK